MQPTVCTRECVRERVSWSSHVPRGSASRRHNTINPTRQDPELPPLRRRERKGETKEKKILSVLLTHRGKTKAAPTALVLRPAHLTPTATSPAPPLPWPHSPSPTPPALSPGLPLPRASHTQPLSPAHNAPLTVCLHINFHRPAAFAAPPYRPHPRPYTCRPHTPVPTPEATTPPPLHLSPTPPPLHLPPTPPPGHSGGGGRGSRCQAEIAL